MEAKRKQLLEEIREANAKQSRLLAQFNRLEEEQRVMVDGELRSIEELEAEERSENATASTESATLSNEFTVDPALWDGWPEICFDGTVGEVPDNS